TFIEATNVDNAIQQGQAGAANAQIKLYLCPSRRTTAQAPGKRDYGYGYGSSGQNSTVLYIPGGGALGSITNSNGTSNTIVLSHLWMDPKTYSTDPGVWSDPTKNGVTMGSQAYQDNNSSGSGGIGGPHPNVLPCLFCDGHVQNIPMTWGSWQLA